MPNVEPETNVFPGQVLSGKYQVTRVIGRGGMGVVVEALRLGLRERVAVKILHQHYCNHPEALARFQHEARAAVAIRGEHSARLLDVGVTDTGLPFIVMELLEGSDLATILRLGSISLHEAVLYVLQACEGMAEVHANGIVHRDLKPGNLFVARRADGTPLVKVLDFGIAKSALPMDDAEKYVTMTLVALGTPLYMSPEQIRSSRHVDARSDIWSLGAILYELLAGRPAFGGNSVTNITAQVLEADPPPISAFAPQVPRELELVIRKALGKRPEHRWVDVAAFAQALAPFAGEAGRAHAERAARILRGEGRGAGAASFASAVPAIDMVPTSTSTAFQQGEDVTTRLTSHRKARDRMLLGVLLGLAIAAVVIGWSVFGAYQEQTAQESPLQIANAGIGKAIPTVRIAQAEPTPTTTQSVDASAPRDASSTPKTSRVRSTKSPVTTTSTQSQEDDDPLQRRK